MSDILPARNTQSSWEKFGNYSEIQALKDKNNKDLSNLLKKMQTNLENNPSKEAIALARDIIRDLEMLKRKYETGTYRNTLKTWIYRNQEDLIRHIEEMTEDFDNLSDEFEFYSNIRKLLDEKPGIESPIKISETIFIDWIQLNKDTWNIEVKMETPILGISNNKLNGKRDSDRNFTISWQKFIIKTQSILETIYGKTNIYEITIDTQWWEQIVVTMEVEKKWPDIWIKSISTQKNETSLK
ncbi:MAG: hypothetical protein ACD_49C00075G0006 [uncultured bacterium (gcode 4)]|uniref:Uncharacterized protein n=1 Tax=uncultured bacterium (gcode 4) TaxID=1234023 RepID=K2BUI2_9BACT|nr:MAG: hypothetical protein ACD_49C00075G0006 [uncultured bacterium (gcode 4)]